MWFSRRFNKKLELQAIHRKTYARIDRATEALDQNAETLDKFNKFLEEEGDIAYNVFMATGGDKRLNKKQ